LIDRRRPARFLAQQDPKQGPAGAMLLTPSGMSRSGPSWRLEPSGDAAAVRAALSFPPSDSHAIVPEQCPQLVIRNLSRSSESNGQGDGGDREPGKVCPLATMPRRPERSHPGRLRPRLHGRVPERSWICRARDRSRTRGKFIRGRRHP